MLAIHIACALIGLVTAFWSVLRPDRRLINASLGMSGLTVASGTYLVLSRPVHILSVCLSGLMYLGVTTWLIIVSSQKLARQNAE